MTDSNFVVKNGLVANGSFTANSTQFGITSAVVANTTTIAIGSATINSTVYSGTSNNANYLGGLAAGSYQTEAGLAANVATLTANNTAYVGSVTAANVVSNAQLSANLANYQTEAGLSANVVTLTANNASYLGGVAATDYARTDTSELFNGSVSIGATSLETDASLGIGAASSAYNRLNIVTDIANPNKGFYNAQTALTIANGSYTANRTYSGNEILVTNYSQGKNANGTQYGITLMGSHNYVWNAGTSGGDAFANLVYGTASDIRNYANGTTNSTINTAYGSYNAIRTFASGKIGTAFGVFSTIYPVAANSTVTGTIAVARAYTAVLGLDSGNASIGTAYMYYGEYSASANVTGTRWGVYTSGETKNYFSGNVGISNTVPTHRLSVNGDTYLGGSLSLGATLVANATTITINDNTIVDSTGLMFMSGGSPVINSSGLWGTANNTLYVGSITAANVVSNAQLSANLANYQTEAGLSANVAKLTANNTSYVGSVTAANVVSNAQLSANLANYQTTAGLSANVAVLSANNASYLGTVAAANYARTDVAETFSANIQIGTSNSTSGGITSVGIGTVTDTGQKLAIASSVDSDDLAMTNIVTGLTNENNAITAAKTHYSIQNNLRNLSLCQNSAGSYIGSTFYGIYNILYNAYTTGGDAYASTMVGSYNDIRNYANSGAVANVGLINYAFGSWNAVRVMNSGNVNNAIGVYSWVAPNAANATVTGVITKGIAYYADLGIASGNTSITTGYMLYGEYNASANVGTKWGVYANGETKNYFSGSVGIGNTVPTHALSIVGDQFLTGNIAFGSTGTINGTSYTGTANNVTYVGSVTAANVVSNAQLSANLANYQTTAGLSANVAVLSANNASYLGGTVASGYQTTAGLSANVAKLTANNVTYVGSITAANVVSNAQLSANLANYQTTAGLSANVAKLTSNNASYLGTVAASSYARNDQATTFSSTVGIANTLSTNTGQIYVGSLRVANGDAGIYFASNTGAVPGTGFIRASGDNSALTLRHAGNGTFTVVTNATNATTGGTTAMTINYLQDITIPNGDLAVTGSITATGNITAYYSDKRLKKDLAVVTDWRDVLSGMTPYRFKWNDTALDLMRNKDTGTQIGFVAQEVQKVLPQAVTEQTATPPNKVPADGQYLTIMPEKIIPVLVAAVKDLTSEVEVLKAEIVKLRG